MTGPLIEPTDEMIAAARDASIALNGHCSTFLETRASLTAVLALLARDYTITPKQAAAPQCPVCTSPYPHHRFALANPDGDGPAWCDHEWHDGWHEGDPLAPGQTTQPHDASAVTSGTYSVPGPAVWGADWPAINTDDRCPDEHQPAHGAGTRPEDCGTCAGAR